MSYHDQFKLADDLITHMDTFVPSLPDQFLRERYIGFLSIAGVTVYELAIKDIFYAFSDEIHPVLGAAARARFDRLNGQIILDRLKGNHINFFGDEYTKRFAKDLKEREKQFIKTNRVSLTTDYSNLIFWRNQFTHLAKVIPTYQEVKDAYNNGKEVIHCLNETMVR